MIYSVPAVVGFSWIYWDWKVDLTI